MMVETCPKCHSIMIRVSYYDPDGSKGPIVHEGVDGSLYCCIESTCEDGNSNAR